MKKIVFILLSILLTFSFIPGLKAADLAPKSKSAILIEASTGKILFEKKSHDKRSPASMTKLMTFLLTMEAIETGKITIDDNVTISKKAKEMGGTQIFVEEGTKVKVGELIKGIGIASANDASVALAEYIAGTEENFAEIMNKRCKELGCKNTNFKNSHGLDEKDHYSSAYDMSLIAKELVKYPEVLKTTSTYEEYINVSGENHWLVNTNNLVRFYEGIDGLKTGFTDQAKYCLTATMKKNDMRLITVVMGVDKKDDRSQDTVAMMEYGFSMYASKNIMKKEKSIGELYIDKAKTKKTKYYLTTDVNVIVDKNIRDVDYKIEKKMDNVKAPLKKGSKVGKLLLKVNKETIEYDLIIKEDIEKASYFRTVYNSFRDIISGNLNLIR